MKQVTSSPEKTQVAVRRTNEELARSTAVFLQKGIDGAANTRAAYKSDINQLEAWLQTHELGGLPISSATLAAYLSTLATQHKWSTIVRRLAAIRKWHRSRNHSDPSADEAIKLVIEGIKRTIGTEPLQAPVYSVNSFKESISTIPDTLTGLRDRTMLLLCFAGAFRRSELVALNVEGVRFTDEGAILSYTGSKTNQYGKTEEKALFYSEDTDVCPVKTLRQYIRELKRIAGPLFIRIRKNGTVSEERLSDKQVARVTKRYLGDDYSAHSHRASFVTIARLNGADDSQIMQQTKHRTRTMIDRYTRVDQITKHNAAKKLGL